VYKINGIPGLDGLLVRGRTTEATTEPSDEGVFDLVAVDELLNVNVIVGDRQLRYPLPPDGLFVSKRYLTEVADPGLREYSTANPFGKYQSEGFFNSTSLEISWAVFSLAATITVISLDTRRTLFSQSFFKNSSQAMGLVDRVMHGKLDPDDLISALQDLKIEER
jgi:hypothetical protein